MESELKSLDRRLFCLLNRIKVKEERDKKEARAIQKAYDRLAENLGMELFDIVNPSSGFELLS